MLMTCCFTIFVTVQGGGTLIVFAQVFVCWQRSFFGSTSDDTVVNSSVDYRDIKLAEPKIKLYKCNNMKEKKKNHY